MGDMILYRSTARYVESKPSYDNYTIMTVVIDESNPDPTTCCSYADDAVGMPIGGDANAQWQEFFGYKPCLFKNGQVVGYLNPNDYSKFEDGGSADIASGDAGDVMIEFPRRGLRAERDGNLLRVSITDAPDNPDFQYYAFTRDGIIKDKMYVSAYPAYLRTSSKPYSLGSRSGVNRGWVKITKNSSEVFDYYRSAAKVNGKCYELFGFHTYQYISSMIVLQFKTIDTANAVSFMEHGYDYNYRTGNGNLSGLFAKWSRADSAELGKPSKTFGIENLFMQQTLLDGIYTIGTRNDVSLAVTMASMEQPSSDYENWEPIYTTTHFVDYPIAAYDYLSRVSGTSKAIWLPDKIEGSSTTYYKTDVNILRTYDFLFTVFSNISKSSTGLNSYYGIVAFDIYNDSVAGDSDRYAPIIRLCYV